MRLRLHEHDRLKETGMKARKMHDIRSAKRMPQCHQRRWHLFRKSINQVQ
jgi:hypothetical protein